jgi:hypothetical protein
MVPTPIPKPEEETVSTLPPILPDDTPDPDLVAQRVSLMRRLLIGAIDRYKQTRFFHEEVEDAMPDEFRDDPAKDQSPDDESRAWWRLVLEAKSDHDDDDHTVAILIDRISEYLAGEGQRPDLTAVGSAFRERAVSIDGYLYVLVDDLSRFQQGTPLIAMVSNDRVIDLDA